MLAFSLPRPYPETAEPMLLAPVATAPSSVPSLLSLWAWFP